MDFNILIIEDEQPNAQRLERLIQKIRPTAKIVSVEDSIRSSIEWLKKNHMPDIIMMDVRLADGVSFEIFNQINIEAPVIFTTAYDEYAVQAFKYNAIDYLLKPVEETDLAAALIKIENAKANKQKLTLDYTQLSNLMDQLNHSKPYRTRFLFPFREGYKSLSVGEIAYFFADVGGNKAVLFDGDWIAISQTLESLEKQLDPHLFFRANRQFIVNIDSIKSIQNYFNGKLKVDLKINNHEELIISREKALYFKEWLDF